MDNAVRKMFSVPKEALLKHEARERERKKRTKKS
jgi:hypothetical protein